MSKFEEVKKDKVEIVNQTEVESQRILVGRLRPKKGHILFEFNPIEKTVKRAEFKVDKEISFQDAAQGLTSQRKEVDGNEGCVYISALNEKNAWKKFLKIMLTNDVKQD